MTTLRALWKKDPGLLVSGGAHVLALVLLLLNFERPPHLDDAQESIPVEMVTTSELNQVMNGEKTEKQLDKPQRRVDKLADLDERHPARPTPEAQRDTPPPPAPDKPNDDPGQADKPVPPVAAVPPPAPTPPAPPVETPPPPTPTPPERPVEKTETPPPPTPPERPVEKAEVPTPPERPEDKPPPPDAEVIAPKPPPRPKVEVKREAKKEVKKPKPVKLAKVVPPPAPTPPAPQPPARPEPPREEPKSHTFDMVAKLLDKLKPDPTPPQKQRAGNEAPEQPHHDFSFDKITSFLDHEAPQRKASTGRQLTQLASLGSPTAHAEKMSPSMMAQLDGWLIDHYRGCWSYFGLGSTQSYVPAVRVKMAQDGSLMAKPALLNPPSDPNLRSLADSAVRAVNRCDPLPIPERYKPYYNAWRDRVVRFDPKEMG